MTFSFLFGRPKSSLGLVARSGRHPHLSIPPLPLGSFNRLPAGLAAILALTVAIELSGNASSAPTADASTPNISVRLIDKPAQASAAFSAIILARPLFRSDRHPLTIAAAVDITLPRLSAIVMTSAGGNAIFAGDGAAPTVVSPGGHLGVYQVLRIAADHVTLSGPNGVVTATPQFAAGSAVAEMPPPASAGPANPSPRPRLSARFPDGPL